MAERTVDSERIRLAAKALRDRGLDALLCALPRNVLLLSGYWPVVGRSLALVTAAGTSALIAPEDERELAQQAWTRELFTYLPSSLDRLDQGLEATAEVLHRALETLGLATARIGYEEGPSSSPVSYAALQFFGTSLLSLLRREAPGCTPVGADDVLAQLGSVPTRLENDRIRLSCGIVREAFDFGKRKLRAGLTEIRVAASFRALLADPLAKTSAQRADGFAFCMSGPNAAKAFAAFQRSSARRLVATDLVLVHCNSHADGYWTDVTRTYCLGPPNTRAQRMYDAIFAARDAALSRIRPGARARDVDRAAREVIEARGFGAGFKHPTGHGVGFAAIDHEAPPRIHPKSQELLESEMVFNVEPGIYEDGFGGIRHCDMVRVTDQGPEILTPFHDSLGELTIPVESPPVTVWED